MKIGFFGNTNNYPLLLAVALRHLGYEVVLVFNSKEPLHRPENRYPEFKTGYPEWIVDGSDINEWDFMHLNFERESQIMPILELLAGCDALVLNDLGPSLLPFLWRPSIGLLTGSDLSSYADYKTISNRTSCWDNNYRFSAKGQLNLIRLTDFIQRQRNGIRDSIAVSIWPRGIVPHNDKLLDEIGVPDKKRFFILMAEIHKVKPLSAPDRNRLRIFCATRFTWKMPIEPDRSSLDYKGSDIMIKGLGMFCRETGVSLDIHFVRKGLHVSQAEALVAEQGLTNLVTWHDEMALVSVWEMFSKCDIVFEQLGGSMIGMAGFDAMASGKPVIGNLNPEIAEKIFNVVPPICQAKTPEDVNIQLKNLVFNPDQRLKIGNSGKKYVETYCSPQRAALEFQKYFELAVNVDNTLTDFEASYRKYFLRKNFENEKTIQQAYDQLKALEVEFNRYFLVRWAYKISRIFDSFFWHLRNK